jgi:exopolyphosphatase/guanosine-5'-triphosphate,3'-diphosphate pyrophosphatase
MKIAAIDVGTNSLHMIIARVGEGQSFEIIDREKDMVRLGAGSLGGRTMADSAVESALQALVRFRRLADTRQVDTIVAVATSAVREARNGGDFLAAARRRAGIDVRVISGSAEARLIHDAAVYGVDVGSTRAVVVDIGGGSTEITLGTAAGARLARSFKLGALRLTEKYVRSDPVSRRDAKRLSEKVSSELDAYLEQIASTGFEKVIGTSGTLLSIGALAIGGGSPPEVVHHAQVPAERIRELGDELMSLTLPERLKVPGLDPRRADIIVAGIVMIDLILRKLGAKELTLCDLSLREGLVLDYIRRHRGEIDHTEKYPDIRRRSVIELGERYHYEEAHARQIGMLALALFDQTRAVHKLDDRAREWLEYAALLHDVGHLIGYAGHHKHSYYLVKNGDLRGFSPEEVEAIALVARYHRSGQPKRSHAGFGDLPRPVRRTIRKLVPMLRIAESLDRSRTEAVSALEIVRRDDGYLLRLRAREDVELEVWAATRHLESIEDLLGRRVRIEVRGDGHPARRPSPRRKRASASSPASPRRAE